MKKTKLIKIALKILISKLFNKIIPISATLSVTNKCNSKCSYCGYRNRKQNDLSLKEIKIIIDTICKLGIERIGFWGGEPLIRKDIEQIIDYALSKDLYITLDTNGYLAKEKINTLKKVNHVIISFDGEKKCHDANRGPDTFEKAVNAIKLMHENRIKFSTITVLTKNNIHKENIDFILDLSKKYNFSTTFQILHHNSTIGQNNINILPTNEQYKKILRYIYDCKKNNNLIASSNNYFKYLLSWSDLHEGCSDKKTNIKCMSVNSYFNIDTDGKVYPCSVLIDEISGINYNSKNLIRDLKKLKESFNCKSCVCGCFVEYNNIFSLNISTIFQWFKNIILN